MTGTVRLHHWVLLISWVLAAPRMNAESQESLVTFYSNGPVRIGVSLISRVAFSGQVFDGTTRLAYLKHGTFVTISLRPGQHTFSASFSSRPAPNSSLSINLEGGKHYYVRTMADVKHAFVFAGAKGVLEQVGCETAQAEAGGTTAVDMKQVATGVGATPKNSSTFPDCQ
jgi:hypothetical protein